MKNQKLFFSKRKLEPEEMGAEENTIFEKVARDKYKIWFQFLVDHIIEETNTKKGEILDVACGPGFLSKELAGRSSKFDVEGMDVSSQMILQARKNCAGLKNTNFRIGSVYKLPYATNSFDLVVCRDSFHHFAKPKPALAEMIRVLKPGAHLYIQDLRRDLPFYLLKQALPRENIFQKLQYYSTRAAFTRFEIIELLKKNVDVSFTIKTRKLNRMLLDKCKMKGIEVAELRANFQAHYILVLRKKYDFF